MGIPLEEQDEERGPRKSLVSRTLRETARHVRSLHDILSNECYDYSRIFKGMALGNQTDKSFSINGRKSIKYLSCRRLAQPILGSKVIEDIILDGSLALLQPERNWTPPCSTTSLQGGCRLPIPRWLPPAESSAGPHPMKILILLMTTISLTVPETWRAHGAKSIDRFTEAFSCAA